MFCKCGAGGAAYWNLFHTRKYGSMQHVTINDIVDEDMQNVKNHNNEEYKQ